MKKIFDPFLKFLSRRSPVAVVLTLTGSFVLAGIALRASSGSNFDAELRFNRRPRAEVADARAGVTSPIAFADDDPSFRYAHRLSEASSIGIGLSLAAWHDRFTNRRVAATAADLIRLAQATQLDGTPLLPPFVNVANPQGVLSTAAGLYYVRYRAVPFGVEVLSVGANGYADGVPFLIRVPERAPTPTGGLPPAQLAGGYASLFTAATVNAYVPPAFADAPVYAAHGWSQEPLRSVPFTQEQLGGLRDWLARAGQGK